MSSESSSVVYLYVVDVQNDDQYYKKDEEFLCCVDLSVRQASLQMFTLCRLELSIDAHYHRNNILIFKSFKGTKWTFANFLRGE